MSLPQNEAQGKTNHSHEHEPSMTQCAKLTGSGRSAIAVVAVEGPMAEAIIYRCVQFASEKQVRIGQVRFGYWTGPAQDDLHANNDSTDETSGSPSESVVITAVSLRRWEIHCHGGTAAIERVLSDLQHCGAQRLVELNSPPSLIVAEAEAVLSRCVTERTAAIALSQIRGGLDSWARESLAAENSGKPSERLNQQAQDILHWADWTMRLAEPWKIVLVGPPNVGKSSLMNALVGYDRSITFDQAGTTRDVLHAETVIDGLPVRLSDTAGMRDSNEPIEAEGMKRAVRAAAKADLVIEVLDAAEMPNRTHPTGQPLQIDPSRRESDTTRIRVINKIDLVESPPAVSDADVSTSAVTGAGIDELLRLIATQLSRLAPPKNAPVVLNKRQKTLVSQIVTASPGEPLATTLQALIGEPQ
ncbi:MAG: GTPase [Planctomycetota bacterium]